MLSARSPATLRVSEKAEYSLPVLQLYCSVPSRLCSVLNCTPSFQTVACAFRVPAGFVVGGRRSISPSSVGSRALARQCAPFVPVAVKCPGVSIVFPKVLRSFLSADAAPTRGSLGPCLQVYACWCYIPVVTLQLDYVYLSLIESLQFVFGVAAVLLFCWPVVMGWPGIFMCTPVSFLWFLA